VGAALSGCAACSSSNNLLLGRVSAKLGNHPVVVSDCYRTSVPAPETLSTPDGTVYHFKPCRDADITIRGTELTVNGRKFGTVNGSDAILVDHGHVAVNDLPRTPEQ